MWMFENVFKAVNISPMQEFLLWYDTLRIFINNSHSTVLMQAIFSSGMLKIEINQLSGMIKHVFKFLFSLRNFITQFTITGNE